MYEMTFMTDGQQLDQLRYALVDRVHELERLLSDGDCAAGYLQSALNDTRALAAALRLQIGPSEHHEDCSNFSR